MAICQMPTESKNWLCEIKRCFQLAGNFIRNCKMQHGLSRIVKNYNMTASDVRDVRN